MKEERSNTNNNIVSNERLLKMSKMTNDDVLKEFDTTIEGLDDSVVEKNKDMYGENLITTGEKDPLIVKFFKTFADPFTLILIGLAILSYITDVVIQPVGEQDPMASIIVMVLVIVSALIKFVQETRSEISAENLSEMVSITTKVKRKNDNGIERPLEEVVVGDIILLAAGDMIPADVRVLQAKDLFISQSALTGESDSVEKFAMQNKGDVENESVMETNNLAFMGSNVISGSSKCIVVNVGDDTFLGQISKTVTGEKEQTSFDKGINDVSWLLIRFMAIMVPIVFFINGFTKGDWLEAFLFAISVAVGLTPEMMPMIVTTNLAKGSLEMAKNKTIVKNLNSMQNFGAIDILCTDKTGTITEDKVVLELYLDTAGNHDSRILRHAFLNSYFQTGLKNLIDLAVISHIDDENMKELTEKYIKVDEIPFDFNRRRMSVVIEDKQGKTQLITKGAVEEMLDSCSFVEIDGEVRPIEEISKDKFMTTVDSLNSKGLRVIAVAQKTNPPTEKEFSVEDEKDMVLMGYLAFLDPPKKSSKEAIEALYDHGVEVKVLTGDNDLVTRYVAGEVGLDVGDIVLGPDIDLMDDDELARIAKKTTVFAKLSPVQKERIVNVLQDKGHVIGFMGDGINDAPAIKAADVGISVDTAVDITKESADIILLEKDLMVLEQGVIEGRKTFSNMIKYIKMTASSNFGNIFSVLAASAFLPFLPMIPIQLLMLNLIYDISCVTMPWDNIDMEYTKEPKIWNASSIGKFMLWLGPISSIFDIATFLVMYFIICPQVAGGAYHDPNTNKALFMIVFNSGWFIESLWSQTFVIHLLRTPKLPFIQSRASFSVTLSTTLGVLFGTILPYTFLGEKLQMYPLPGNYFIYLLLIIFGYFLLTTVVKRVYINRYNEFL